MKITKRQLRRIIKEEKAKVLAEQKVRRIVRRTLLEAKYLYDGPATGVGGDIPPTQNLPGPYPPEYTVKFRKKTTSRNPKQVWNKEQGSQPGLASDDSESFADGGPRGEVWWVPRDHGSWMWETPADIHRAERWVHFVDVTVNDALASLEPDDPRYQLIDAEAKKLAGKKGGKKGGKVKLNTLTGWESLRDHPQWDEGMSDVLAVVKKNGGRGISAYMDEETASDRNDLVQLENGFKETKRINHETAMDSGTIIIGTVGKDPVAIWDVMGYQTWMY